MVRYFLKNKKGVSEIIAGLIIMLIVSFAGTVLYAYSIEAFSKSWSHFVLSTNAEEKSTRERFSVISLWWDNGISFNLTILNFGKNELVIDAVYIDGVRVAIDEGKGIVIPISEKISVKFTSSTPIQVGLEYEILVISARGNRDVVIWKA